MKVSTKIYHLLQDKVRAFKSKGANKNFIEGYKTALLDSIKMETSLKKGEVKFNIQKQEK